MTFRRFFIPTLILAFMLLATPACNFPMAEQSGRKDLPDSTLLTAVESAFLEQAEAVKDEEIVFTLFDLQIDHIEFSDDQSLALVWFALLDPPTGELLATVPGLVIAVQVSTPSDNPDSWKMTFQHQQSWTDVVWDLPEQLMSQEEKQTYTGKTQPVPHDSQIFTGYKLPWPQGIPIKLSGSIAHVYIYKTCPDTCLYAFDFWNGEMFPVSAAKSGVVKRAIWEHPNGNTQNTNYILIEDTSTNPTTYQIYYHLAYDSIPENLRTPGAPVYQGQFIGLADDTGASTAHHLHFMVHTNPNSYWGNSVDIVFDEVLINNGRPRTCIEAENFPEYGSQCVTGDWFISQNAAELPPTIVVSSPTQNQVIETLTFPIIAEANDDNGVASIQAYLRQDDEGWMLYGEPQSSASFFLDVNLCESNFTSTSIDVALEVTDTSGKVTSTKNNPISILNNFPCEEYNHDQECMPNPYEITLFNQANYLGACTKLSPGEFSNMAEAWEVGSNETASIKVGENVYTILFTDANMAGCQETFTSSDPDLSDNPTGNNSVSSLIVSHYPPAPSSPILPNSFIATDEDRLGIAWNGDGERYYASLVHNGELIRTKDWFTDTYWELGSLTVGEYEMFVIAKNISGTAESSFTFTIIEAEQPLPHVVLNPLEAISPTTRILLSWSVPIAEENVQSFVLQYRINHSQEWELLTTIENPSARELETFGRPGDIIEFRIRAIALNGDAEPWSVDAETRTTIQDTCQQDVYDLERQNLPEFEAASNYELGETQLHNFCGEGDVDWIRFTSTKNQKASLVLVETQLPSPLIVSLYDETGVILLQTQTLSQDSTMVMELEKEKTYHLKFEPGNEYISGTDTYYEFKIQSQGLTFLSTLYLVLLGVVSLIIKLLNDQIKNHKAKKKNEREG
ncbi:MAG: M23 family metallopeptidase [Anaerolineaceae bacterium]|nr:M23 family metallopeptidase [Anaerolineaceae bacterium]